MSLKYTFPTIVGIIFLGLAIVACGGSSTSSSTPTPKPTSTKSNTQELIQTATATVKGKSETILTNAKGMTLYYFTPDTATTVACSSGCTTTWPALLSEGSSTITSPSTIASKLTVAKTANGNQVEYNGHPLYTYSGDTQPGQMTGNDVNGKWFVAAETLASQGAPSSAPTSTPNSGY